MSDLHAFLETGERLGERSLFREPENGVAYDVVAVEKSGRRKGDRVFLMVHEVTDPCVLLVGNPVKLDVLKGVGRLLTVELATGKIRDAILETGIQDTVPTGY